MTYSLFLDDERHPVNDNCVVVRDYYQACGYVVKNGTPIHVDFDHDLGTGPTGYDFAKWLVDRSLDGHGFPQSFDVHSQNPIGRRNIIDLMNGYMQYCTK